MGCPKDGSVDGSLFQGNQPLCTATGCKERYVPLRIQTALFEYIPQNTIINGFRLWSE